MSQLATSSQSRLQTGLLGRLRSGTPQGLQVQSSTPATGGTAQVYTIASGSPSNETEYGLRVVINSLLIDETISFTTDASATAAELEAGLAAEWNANGVLAGIGTAVASTDLVITMLDYTTDATITGSDAASIALLTITETTAPSAASTFAFGRWVQTLAPSGRLISPRHQAIAAPTQGAVAFTITSDASGSYSAVVIATDSITGAQESEDVSWAGDATPATTYANAEAALEAAFPGTGFAVGTASNVVTLTAPLGWDLSVVAVQASGGSAALTTAITEPGALPPIAWVMDPQADAPTTIGGDVTAIAAGKAAPLLMAAGNGEIVVEDPGATITYAGTVYVETAAGATNGRPYTVQSATGTRMPLPKSLAYWVGQEPTNANLAIIHHA